MPPSAAHAGPPPRHVGLRHLARHGAQVMLANCLVAAITAPLRGVPFFCALVYAQIIGMTIWIIFEGGRACLPREQASGWPAGWAGVGLVSVACVAGFVVGTTAGDAIFGYSTWSHFIARPFALFGEIGMAATFSTVIAGWFYLRSRAATHQAQVAAAAHDATLARLVLLQSQLEPHMLFNTLANLRALIVADPERAQAMLDRLIDFLRATLNASRVTSHPLADEFARVDDYLALMRVRMGERLHAVVALPAELAHLDVPPLLLQPLVENAIKHGLEPRRGHGELHVTARLEGTTLVLSVDDDGQGLADAPPPDGAAPAPGSTDRPAAAGGFGLSQVRERLHTLHGEAARFTLARRPGGGTRAEIRLPVCASSLPDGAPIMTTTTTTTTANGARPRAGQAADPARATLASAPARPIVR